MSCSTKIFACEKNFSYCITSSLRNVLGIYKLPNSFVASHIGRIRGLCDNLSLQSNDENAVQQSNTKQSSTIEIRKPLKYQQRHSKNIISHLQQCNDELDMESIPQKYISKRYKLSDSFYVVGKKTADAIAESVILDNNNIPVFEINPGFGVVTKALLEKGVHEVHAFQSPLWANTRELKGNYDRLFLHKYDFFTLWKRLLLDYSNEGEEIQALLSIVKPKLWNDGPPVKIFAAVPNKVFINHMIASIVFQRGFYQLGRLEFYLAMRPGDYHCATSDESASNTIYRASSVLFQIMFERKLLCKLPAKDFIPWMRELSERRKKLLPQLTETDLDSLYLVKVIPRRDLQDIVQGADNLKALWHFVRQCFTLRKSRVIPTLEKWIPGCGPRLIFNNMTIFTMFGELSPSQMLKLFQMFSSWPEYPDCPFLDSMENYILKSYVESNPDGISEAEFESVDGGMEIDPNFDDISVPKETLGNV